MAPARDVPELSFENLRCGIWQRETCKAVARFRGTLSVEDSSRSFSTSDTSTEELLSISGFNATLTNYTAFRNYLKIWARVLNAIDNCASGVNPRPSSIVWSSLKYITEQVRKMAQQKRVCETPQQELLHMTNLVAQQLDHCEAAKLCTTTLLESAQAQDEMVSIYTSLTSICCKAMLHFGKKKSRFWSRSRGNKSDYLDAIRKMSWVLGTENKISDTARNPTSSDIYRPEKDDHGHGGGQMMTRYIILPLDPIPQFFGRKETIDRVYSYFTNTPAGGISGTSVVHPRTSVLWGMPGVGKTQIAVALAYKLKHRYCIPNIFWISADQSHNLAEGFMQIARLVDSIPDKCLTDQKMAISEVKKWFERSSQDWLLVFDNAPDSRSLEEFWPHSEKGRILVTTRNAGLSGFAAHPEQITPFDDADGVECFLQFLPNDLRQEARRSPDTISELVSKLGALPLALAQAASFICETRCSIPRYLDLFKDCAYRAALLDPGAMNNACKTSVGATFKLAYESVGDLNQKAQELLDMLSWFDPDMIPENILNPSFGLFGGDPILFEGAMAILLRTGLLVRSKGFSSIHRLIQTTLVHQMDHNNRIESFRRGIRYIKASFSTVPSCDSLFPLECPPLDEVRHVLPQILALYQKNQEFGCELQDSGFADLCSWMGSYFMDISNMEGARQMLQKSHDIYAQFEECKHRKASVLGGLGWLVMREGRLVTALEVTNQAVQLMEEAVGPKHPHNSWVLSNRGRIHLFGGEIRQSLEDSSRSFEIMKQVDHERQHTELSTAALSVYRNFYAISLYAHVRGGVSGDLYEPSLDPEGKGEVIGEIVELEEKEAMKGPIELCRESIRVLLNRSDCATSLAWVELTLSWMLLHIGDLEGAEQTTLACLKHTQQDYSPEVCGVGVAKIQLADCYSRQGNYMQAFCEYTKALENLESSVGRQNPLYIIGSHKMANFLCQRGEFEKACGRYEFCLEELSKLYGKFNPATNIAQNNLGIALINVNKKARGLELLHGSLVYRERRYGSWHKFTRRARVNYEQASVL